MDDYTPTVRLRFVKRVEAGGEHDPPGMMRPRFILQQRWTRQSDDNLIDEQWRDVPVEYENETG